MIDHWALIDAALTREQRPVVSVNDLREEAETSAHAGLWRGERSAVFVRIESTSTGETVMQLAPAGGDLDELMDVALPQLEDWARSVGVTQVLIQAGRDGWERVMKPRGYERTAIVLRKVF